MNVCNTKKYIHTTGKIDKYDFQLIVHTVY